MPKKGFSTHDLADHLEARGGFRVLDNLSDSVVTEEERRRISQKFVSLLFGVNNRVRLYGDYDRFEFDQLEDYLIAEATRQALDDADRQRDGTYA